MYSTTTSIKPVPYIDSYVVLCETANRSWGKEFNTKAAALNYKYMVEDKYRAVSTKLLEKVEYVQAEVKEVVELVGPDRPAHVSPQYTAEEYNEFSAFIDSL